MMDPEIYKQIGELTGRFNTFEQNMSNQFNEVKQAIKDQSVVPYSVYDKHVESSDKAISVLREDVDNIQDNLNIRANSLSGKLDIFLDNTVVKIIGSSFVGLVLIVIYWSYQKQIDNITQMVDNINKANVIDGEINTP